MASLEQRAVSAHDQRPWSGKYKGTSVLQEEQNRGLALSAPPVYGLRRLGVARTGSWRQANGASATGRLTVRGMLSLEPVHDLSFFRLARLGRLALGGDLTLYRMSADLEGLYGGSKSFHVFLRWRPRNTGAAHVH